MAEFINSITIKNYRGIKELEIDKFRKYNFFVGDNSSCKTTLLEAILCSLPNIIAGLIGTANTRGMAVRKENIENFFYNADIKNKIGFILNNEIETEIEVKNRENEKILNIPNQTLTMDKMLLNGEVFEILYNFSQKMKKEKFLDVDVLINKKLEIERKVNISEINVLEKLMERYENSFWISPFTKYQQSSAKIIKNLIENKQKEDILNIIKMFEPDIDDIFSDGREVLISKKNIKKMLSVSSFGNGLAAILDIVSSFLQNEVKYIFIDEIETGIHHLNYKRFCKAIVEITNKKNIQVFMTTHSKEFLESFYEELKETKDDICLYRFQKINNNLNNIYYSKERVMRAIKNGWDIR